MFWPLLTEPESDSELSEDKVECDPSRERVVSRLELN